MLACTEIDFSLKVSWVMGKINPNFSYYLSVKKYWQFFKKAKYLFNHKNFFAFEIGIIRSNSISRSNTHKAMNYSVIKTASE